MKTYWLLCELVYCAIEPYTNLGAFVNVRSLQHAVSSTLFEANVSEKWLPSPLIVTTVQYTSNCVIAFSPVMVTETKVVPARYDWLTADVMTILLLVTVVPTGNAAQ